MGCLVLCVALGVWGCSSDGEGSSGEGEPEEVELADGMASLQRWTHKTALALEARNAELADFYLHEVEETVDRIQNESPTYEGYQVAELTEQILVPEVEALETVVDERDWSAVDARVERLAQSCNRCHQETDHGFVRISYDSLQNPYTQSFSSK